MVSAEVAADDVRLALAAVEEPAGLGGELGLVTGPAVHGQTPFEVGVDQFSRFATVQGSMDRQGLTRRLSEVRACFGWLSWPGGCGHVGCRKVGRHGWRGRGRPPQMAGLTSTATLWTSFPEPNRCDVLRLLSMLLERSAVPDVPGDGIGGEPGAAA